MEKAADADYAAIYGVFDLSGRRLRSEEHPGVRAARGERFENVPVDWVTPAGRRSIVVSAHTVPLGGVGDVALVTFEDVTELEAARRRAALLAEAGTAAGAPARPARGGRRGRRAGGPRLRGLGVRRAAAARRQHRARGDGDGRPVQALARRALRPPVPARPGLRGRLPAGDPHRRAAADRGDPRRVRRARRPGAGAAGGPHRDRAALHDDRAAARPRPRDRRPRARHGRVDAPLRAGGPGSSPRSSRTAARSRSTTPGCSSSSATPSPAPGTRARRSTRSSGGVADAVTAQAPDGALVYANEAAVRMVGYDDVEEMLAAPPGEVAARLRDDRRARRAARRSSACPAAARCAASSPSR